MGTHQGDSPPGLTTGTHHRGSATGTHPGDSPMGTHPWNSPGGLTHRDSSRGLTRGTHPQGLTRGLTHGDPPQGLTHRDSPRSVLGPASRCLNLSSREASLSLKAELLRALDSGAPPSTTVAACGRDWDLCKGAASLALPARRGGGERREVRPRGSAHSQAPTGRPHVRHTGSAAAWRSRLALTELWRAACWRQRTSRLPRRAHCPPGRSSGKQTSHERQDREKQKTTAHVGRSRARAPLCPHGGPLQGTQNSKPLLTGAVKSNGPRGSHPS